MPRLSDDFQAGRQTGRFRNDAPFLKQLERRRQVRGLLLLALAIALNVRAQEPQPAAQITGRVVRADNGTPIPGATVYLEPPFYSGAYQFQTAITDSNGNYSFPTVSNWTYEIRAYASGFVPAKYHRDESSEDDFQKIDSSTHLRGIDFRLSIEAVIRGTVVDPNGHPVAKDITVNAVRRGKLFDGADGFLTATHALTDAEGHFTLKQLPPGTYYVVVNGPYGFERSTSQGIHYQETWYGNKPSADGAKQITLQQGDAKEGVEITVKPENHYKVIVWPTGPEGAPKPDHYIFSLLNRNYTSATGQHNGSYIILDIPPGHYTMVSTAWAGSSPTGQGQADFDVSDADVTLHIDAGSPGEIQGFVNWKGTPNSAPVVVLAAAVQGGTSRIDRGADGRFSLPNVLPGKYVFVLLHPPSGTVLQSAQCSGVAVTASTPLQVGDKQTVTGCELTLSSQ